MNICLLSDTYPPDPGGLAISARRLATGLAAAGHTVQVCLIGQELGPGQVRRTVETGVQVHRLGPHRRLDDTRSDWFGVVTSLHREAGFDIVHGYYLVGAGFVATYAGRYLNLPVVVSARGNDLDRTVFDPGPAGPILWTLANASAVTAVSTDLARKARALSGRPVQVIPNGVDTSVFAPGPRDPGLAAGSGLDGELLIGFVGEARLKKGLTILLPAFARLAAESKAALRLVLAGGVRPDAADILAVFQAQQPNLSISVLPYTAHGQLSAVYNLLDVLVLPSLRDGLPNALLEGMACGRAVVAAEVGGIPDVLRHGQNGLLFPPGNVEALAEALATLLPRPEYRAALGRAARQTVRQHFTPERELAANLELYTRLTGSTATGKPPTNAAALSAR
jgi:glycosyltransferase involved in cell wall biosynthesis